eukprot:CAMPEP_0170528118 /NCGR_PEP_ID=MMETSP0209-20121228/13612_1 /TAXON_ID=665100 ORGANISM="Litonotus pictus, Strain P1" /NCGR_SAMPLE_ID=MMETSP0209 /ASSEMBLY_ACC=CAM_ASM_000301 /LENGTH=318 /DNA_ID=CAMNT_0010819123 /DNA_START=523 /DNA_END=1475 /DNA_ORIENTATION=+
MDIINRPIIPTEQFDASNNMLPVEFLSDKQLRRSSEPDTESDVNNRLSPFQFAVSDTKNSDDIRFDRIEAVASIYYGIIWLLMIINYCYLYSTIRFLKYFQEEDEEFVSKYISSLIQYPVIQFFIVFPQTIAKFTIALGYNGQTFPALAVCLITIQGILYTISYGYNNQVRARFKYYLMCIFCCKCNQVKTQLIKNAIARDTLGNTNETPNDESTESKRKSIQSAFSNISDYYSEKSNTLNSVKSEETKQKNLASPGFKKKLSKKLSDVGRISQDSKKDPLLHEIKEAQKEENKENKEIEKIATFIENDNTDMNLRNS